MYNFREYSVLYNKALRSKICEGVILLRWGKHLRNRIISLTGGVWVHKTSLSPPTHTLFFIELTVPRHVSDQVSIYVCSGY